MKTLLELDPHSFSDVVNLASGLFSPLKGFLIKQDYNSVLHHLQLASGEPWTIPISLAVPRSVFDQLGGNGRLHLVYEGEIVGHMIVEDRFLIDPRETVRLLFGTEDSKHPGVRRELARSPYRIGGWTVLTGERPSEFGPTPDELKSLFRHKGWKTVAGFQTRNPVHAAHEHLLRLALEYCDGLLINPLVGWKKHGDFTEAAVNAGYDAMLQHYFPPERVHFQGLRTEMRYAGPREALFHAFVRRNQGCTHFIIGRDHAGAGKFYAPYQAHELARRITATHRLGIELLLFKEPYYCARCKQIVSESSCRHGPDFKREISGTLVRTLLREKRAPDEWMMRPEVSAALLSLGDQMFVNQEDK